MDNIPLTADIEAKKPYHNNNDYQKIIIKIKALLKARNAVLIAHYYVDNNIQQLAETTGGFVADSLDMAKFGKNHPAKTLIVAGVKFMGETAKILNPEKTILMPDLQAECSLDLGCDVEDLQRLSAQYPNHKIVVYSNTSYKVKAMADFVVTSSIAIKLITKLKLQGEKIIWAPDKHLGKYLQTTTGADMILWDATCVVHDEFKVNALLDLQKKYPKSKTLAHPESPDNILKIADFVGSTTQIINYAKTITNPTLIIATDRGIFYKLQQAVPNKKLIPAPTFGNDTTCISCAHCPWMAMNYLDNILHTLETGNNEIILDKKIAQKALRATERMFDFV